MSDASDPVQLKWTLKLSVLRFLTIGLACAFVVASFPPGCHPWLAWVAIAPVLCVALQGGIRNCVLCGALFEFCFFGGQFALISPGIGEIVPLEQFTAMTCLCLVAVAIIGAVSFRVLHHLVSQRCWPVAIAIPVVWTIRDMLLDVSARRIVGTTADLFQLAITQTRWPIMIQIADLLGMSGVTWIVASLNGAITDGWLLVRRSDRQHHRRWTIGVCFSFLQIAFTLTYGGWRLCQTFPPGPRCIVIPQLFGFAGDDGLPRIDDIPTREVVLAIWPESPYSNTTIVPGVPESEILSRANRWKIPLLVGVKRLRDEDLAGPYNSMVLIAPSLGITGTYDKMFLAPVVECNASITATFESAFGTSGNFKSLDLVPGSTQQQTLEVSEGNLRLGVGICHDICFREWGWVTMSRSLCPDFLVNCASEAWDKTDHGRSLLLACTQLRAVECRRSIVRCVRDGYSAVIDSNGRLLHRVQVKQMNQPFVTPQIPPDARKSLFSSFHQWPIMCLTMATVFFALFVFPIREGDVDAR